MAKQTRRSKKKTPRDWKGYGRIALRCVSVLLLIVLAFSLVFGVGRLRTHAEGRLLLAGQNAAPDRVGAFTVSFAWPALRNTPGETWMRPEDMASLTRIAESVVRRDAPLSVVPLRAVSETLGDTGWFDGDPVVRRVGPGRIDVDGDWRIPAAVVRWEGIDHLVSDAAMPMPVEVPAGGLNLPFIEGVYSGAVVRGAARYANPWPGPGVRVGLDLLGVIRSRGLGAEVSGIDVAGYLNGGPIEIVSADGNRVVWGSPVDEWIPGEPTVNEKIARLEQLIERTGAIDAGQRRVEIHRARVEIDRTGSLGGGTGSD